VEPETNVADSDRIGREIAQTLTEHLPEMRSFTWAARAASQ
jgi:5S rRNA maturation endonuclease (ribonuclease M5)